MLATRPTVSSRSARQRLIVIQQSIKVHKNSATGAVLQSAEPRDYATQLGIFLERYEFSKKLEELILHANSTMTVGSFVLSSIGGAIGCSVFAFIFLHTLSLVAIAALIGSLPPYITLRIQRDRRLNAFNAALPDAIDMMARALRAGHSMGSSIELVTEQAPEPLASEFFQVFQQQKLGLQFRDALLKLGTRIPSRDLQFLITAILVQKETGGDLTDILDRTSHVIRDRIRIHAEVRTHTAQGRLTGWILSLLPVILLVILNIASPGYSDALFRDPTGQKLLYASVALIVLGGFIIRKIVDIKV
jgi:tight adherence protein B